MQNQRIRVIDLAKELGVRPIELLRTAEELNVNVKRSQAVLQNGQAHQLRNYYRNIRHHEKKRRQTAPPPTMPPRPVVDDRSTATCTCCGYAYLYVPLKESRELCSLCRQHFARPGEPGWQTQVRLEEHVDQARAKVDAYREASEKLVRERDLAYSKRDKWMAALVEIIVAHGPDEDTDGCACGSPEVPCATRRHLRQVNRGIFDRCEELEGLNEREFNRVLYGRDYSYFSEWDDGVA